MCDRERIIAVDFDGCLCQNAWPDIGEARRDVITALLLRQRQGAKIILWTCRVGRHLDAAVQWCAERGITFDAVNANLPVNVAAFGNDCRKIYNLANSERFPEWIEIRNSKMTAIVGCTESTLAAARLTLIQKGLIEYKKKGKGKGATCWYKINYFSLRDGLYRNNYGNNNSETTGENDGKTTGETNGESAGQYININKTVYEDEEEDFSTPDSDYIPAGDRTMVHSPLHNPTPTEGLVGVQSGAGASERTPVQRALDEQRLFDSFKRRGRRMVYAPREHEPGPVVQREVERIKSLLETPAIRHLYGDGLPVLNQIADSDYYPVMLIDYAIEKTVERNRMYPAGLDCPIAYTVKLLDDWKRSDYHLPVDVRRAKDDYSDNF